MMRMTIDIDLTPEEARTFFGMPDVKEMNELVMSEMMSRAKENMDTLADPERFVTEMMSMSGKGMEGFQAMMAAAMGGKK